MPHGKNIRIYLADGTVSGIRHAEVVNWTGQAIACARSRVAELKEWAEAKRPGVYFLFGVDDSTAASRAYLGEAENVLDRLSSHVRTKDFWNEVIFFTSKDELLTKAHVKYLESRLLTLARAAGRYEVENGVEPEQARLPRGEVDAMEEFIENLRVLLGSLGHRVLEPLAGAATPAGGATTDGAQLHFGARDARASGVVTEDGFVVLRGSTAVKEHTESLNPGYVQLRTRLIADGVLSPRGQVFEFTRDHLFGTASAAAAVIAGSNRSGPEVWKDDAGRTLRQLEEASTSVGADD